MHSMFSMCTNVNSINLSGIDTSHVTDMCMMFWCNYKLTSLVGITEFDTSNVTDMNGMFFSCSVLPTLDLSSFNTSKVTDMKRMFGLCKAMTTLDISTFDTSNVTDMTEMFKTCDKLKTIIVSRKWNTSNVTESTDMFTDSTELIGGNRTLYNRRYTNSFFARIDTKATPGYFTLGNSAVFDVETGTLTIRGYVDKADVQEYSMDNRVKSVYAEPGTVFPADSSELFMGLGYATDFDLSNADTSNVTTMADMFNSCESAKTINAKGWDTSNVTDLSWMFYRCHNLDYIDNIQGWITDSVTTLQGMFYDSGVGFIKLGTELAPNDPYPDAWRTDNVTDYSMMFYHCFSLEGVQMMNFALKSNAKTSEMFTGDSKMQLIYFFRNFEIKADMELKNTDGWTYFGGGRAIRKISGDGTYAVMPAQPDRISPCASLKRYTKVDYSAFPYDTIALAGSMPYPGSKFVGTSQYVLDYCTVDYEHSGWYDVDQKRFLARDEAMQFYGAYVYIVRLVPKTDCYFENPTPDQIDAMKIPYLYDHDHSFLNVEAAHLNDDGTLDVYAVLRNPATIDCSLYISNFKTLEIASKSTEGMILPEGTVFVNGYNANFRRITTYRLPEFPDAEFHYTTPTSIELYENTAMETVNDDYLNYVVKEKGYEVSIDGVNYKDMKQVLKNYEPFTGLKPSTEYTVSVRLKGANEPFFTQKVSTNAADELEGGGYIDSYSYAASHMNLTFSHNVALNNNLGIVYYIPKSELNGYENVKLIIQKEKFNESGSVRTIASDELTSYKIENSGYGDEYVFTYKNIAAREMGSKIYATVYAEKNGKAYISQIDEYSVSTYAMNKLNKSSTKAALKTLLVDMLNYGAAAQTYFNYNTGHLVNSSLTAAQKKLGTSASSLNITSDASETKISSPKAQFSGKNLLLGNNVAIVYYMTFDSSVNKNNVTLKLTYTTVKGETITKTVPFKDFINGDYANEYRFDFTEVQAKDSCQPVTAVLYEGSKQISNKNTYSVQTYAYNKLKKSTTSTELKSIINALMVYCKSAKNYFSA